MEFKKMFGIVGGVPREKVKIEERDILSLFSEDNGKKPKAFVVGETVTLMGSFDRDNIDAKIIALKPGDEIALVPRVPFDKYETLTRESSEFPELAILVFNSENQHIGQIFYFRREQLEGRKIKINTKAKLKYR